MTEKKQVGLLTKISMTPLKLPHYREEMGILSKNSELRLICFKTK